MQMIKIHQFDLTLWPIGSMYAIYGNIYHQYTPNVSIYTIHGSYGWIHLTHREIPIVRPRLRRRLVEVAGSPSRRVSLRPFETASPGKSPKSLEASRENSGKTWEKINKFWNKEVFEHVWKLGFNGGFMGHRGSIFGPQESLVRLAFWQCLCAGWWPGLRAFRARPGRFVPQFIASLMGQWW